MYEVGSPQVHAGVIHHINYQHVPLYVSVLNIFTVSFYLNPQQTSFFVICCLKSVLVLYLKTNQQYALKRVPKEGFHSNEEPQRTFQ